MRVLGLLLVGVAVGALAMWAYQGGRRQSPESEGGPAGREVVDKRSVFAIGTLEPRGGPVLVTSPLVGTQVREVLVREGEVVSRGQELLTLDATVAEEEWHIAQSQRAVALERQQFEVVQARQRLGAAALAL